MRPDVIHLHYKCPKFQNDKEEEFQDQIHNI